MLSTKAQKLQESLEEFESKLNRKDRETSRVSSTNMAHEELIRTLNEKILILTEDLENKDINIIRLNG